MLICPYLSSKFNENDLMIIKSLMKLILIDWKKMVLFHERRLIINHKVVK